jgi:hypothetical protein
MGCTGVLCLVFEGPVRSGLLALSAMDRDHKLGASPRLLGVHCSLHCTPHMAAAMDDGALLLPLPLVLLRRAPGDPGMEVTV